MIMIIAIINFFFVLHDISSTFQNFFQKILSPPEKIHSSFLLTPPSLMKSLSLRPTSGVLCNSPWVIFSIY